jgi:hypothetical protein
VVQLSCTLEEAEQLLVLTEAIHASVERVRDDAVTCHYHEDAAADALDERQWALALEEPAPL